MTTSGLPSGLTTGPDRDGWRGCSSALVVGGGLSGMQSALLLAQTGRKVYLLDAAPGIGGSLHLLDQTLLPFREEWLTPQDASQTAQNR